MKERHLVVNLYGSTVGIAETSYQDGKFSATTESGEKWPMVELRPINWKRGKLHIKDYDIVKLERRPKHE